MTQCIVLIYRVFIKLVDDLKFNKPLCSNDRSVLKMSFETSIFFHFVEIVIRRCLWRTLFQGMVIRNILKSNHFMTWRGMCSPSLFLPKTNHMSGTPMTTPGCNTSESETFLKSHFKKAANIFIYFKTAAKLFTYILQFCLFILHTIVILHICVSIYFDLSLYVYKVLQHCRIE